MKNTRGGRWRGTGKRVGERRDVQDRQVRGQRERREKEEGREKRREQSMCISPVHKIFD